MEQEIKYFSLSVFERSLQTGNKIIIKFYYR